MYDEPRVASHAHPRNKPRRSPRNVQRDCLASASVGSRLEQHFVLMDWTILRVRSTLPGRKTSLPQSPGHLPSIA